MFWTSSENLVPFWAVILKIFRKNIKMTPGLGISIKRRLNFSLLKIYTSWTILGYVSQTTDT